MTIDQFKRYLYKSFPVNLINKLCDFLELPVKMDFASYIDII